MYTSIFSSFPKIMLDQEILIFIADLADSFAYAAFNHRLNILIIKIALSVKLLVRRVYEKFFDNFLLSLKNEIKKSENQFPNAGSHVPEEEAQ